MPLLRLPTAGTPGGLKWNLLMPDDTDADVSFDTTKPHHGYASLKIDYTTTTGNASLAGATNRGMGNEGLTFTAGMPYEGYLFAKASAGTRLTVAYVLVRLPSLVRVPSPHHTTFSNLC